MRHYPPAVAGLFGLNAWIVARLFRMEYLPYFSSIEGAFISLARYIRMHWPAYEWFPMWFEGMPFASVYQPGLHYAVAATAAVAHWTPAHAYHFVTAIAYCMGPVALFVLAMELGVGFWNGLAAGVLYSLLSPSLFLMPELARDAGGMNHARRLQALVVYGEGPNVTGLTLLLFAMAALSAAHRKGTPSSIVLAAFGLASVAATSWPSTVALSIAVGCYCLASFSIRRTLLIGGLAYGLGCAAILPSTVLRTLSNANSMGDAPVKDVRYFGSWVALILLIAGLCWALRRVGFVPRFTALWAASLLFIVLVAGLWRVQMLPQAMRFHLAMEAPVILMLVMVPWRWMLVLTAVCLWQLPAYLSYASEIIRPVDVRSSVEYKEAEFFDHNLGGKRVYAPGSVSFWMNAFTETPQLTGCCDQSILNSGVRRPQYAIPTEHADEALLWLQAYGVHAIAVSGPGSTEAYKPFAHPGEFAGLLRELWRDRDDVIYEVPQAPGLVRVTRLADLVPDLRQFVAGLQAPGAVMRPDQVFEVAINYHPGWSARVNGQPQRVHPDAFGFIVVEPHCNGPCKLELTWRPGLEPQIAVAVSILTCVGAALWVLTSRRTRKRGSGPWEVGFV